MAASPVVAYVLCRVPRLAAILREQLRGSVELNALVTVKDVNPDG